MVAGITRNGGQCHYVMIRQLTTFVAIGPKELGLTAKFTRTCAHGNAGLNSCKFQSEVCFKFAAVSKKL